ncbi:MAG TPA: YfiR family protein [Woeseiaceae bacterium]|nr:YfiR family protein [Woeseiaceae bacterium]
MMHRGRQRRQPLRGGFGPRRFAAAVMAIVLLASLPLGSAGAQEQVYSAERVKAAFLYHFATYINWPESVDADDTFSIAVLGADKVATELERFLPGHTIQGRPMQVHRLRSLDDLAADEVLYIGADENGDLRDHLDEIAAKPLLVVTDTPDGLREGAMINFRIVDQRVRFEISQRAAQEAGLEMSSRLLSAAMSVESAGAIIDLDDTVVALDHNGRMSR